MDPIPPQPPADADATMAPVDPASAMTQLPNSHTAPTALAGGRDATAATVVAGSAGSAATVVGDEATAATVITQGTGNSLDALVGRTLGGCRIESLLGRGGMGAVFKAQQESLGRAVALKVMLPGRDADPQFASRFQREARVVASLNHPHVVQVYDTGRGDDGMLYLLMEFVDGRSLAQVIRDQGPLPIPVVLAIMRESAEGLAAAHAKALVHRDIKPDNLMIDASGRVKVMDFGLARPTEGGSGDSALTMSGMILGTPNYISPEAARGEPADIRADLYSLGVTLWQCVAGKLPFTGPTPVQVLVQHIEAAPPDLTAAMPSCPRTVAGLCLRLLAKRPEDRFSTPAELITAITAIEQQLCGRSARLRWEGKVLVADATLSAEVAGSRSRSHAPAIMATLVVILALIGLTIGAVWYALRDPQPMDSLAVVSDPTPSTAVMAPALAASGGPAAPPTEPVATPIEADPVGATTTPVPVPPTATAVPPAEPAPMTTAATSPTLPAEAPPVATIEPPVEAPAPAVPAQPAQPASAVAIPALPSEPPSLATIEPPAAAPSAPALVPIATVPPAVPARPASLFVSSIPSGATVELDGVAKGTTPCSITGVPAGEHRLRVHGNGIDERTVVVLPGGRVTRISTPLPEPARLELLDLPAQARVTVDGKPYAPGMAVLTGTITVQVIGSGGARAFQVETVVGRNVFGYTE